MEFLHASDTKILSFSALYGSDRRREQNRPDIVKQGDEVLPEEYIPAVKQAMERYKDDKRVEGLLFNYLHFYGSYNYVGNARRWYQHEIRVVRNNKAIRSYRDAQGFRIDGRKLHVKPVDAFIYHYGWVRPPKFMQEKVKNFSNLYHDEQWVEDHIPKVDEFDYSNVESLKLFTKQHPAVMQQRIKAKNWEFSFDPTIKRFSLTERFLHFIEKVTGKRPFEYKNYTII